MFERYIVRPRRRTRNTLARHLDRDSRLKQTKALKDLQESSPIELNLNEWIQHEIPNGAKAIKHYSFHQDNTGPSLGSHVLDLSPEQVSRLEKDLPEAEILRDRPLVFFEPIRGRELLDSPPRSPWHLQAVQVTNRNGRYGTGSGVTVAVLDTGIEETHPALSGKIEKAVSFNVDQWQVVSMATSIDTNGHGTHVAGLIAGKGVGIAPGAKLINGLMLPNARANLSDFILALQWVKEQPQIQIVNISAGLSGFVPELEAEIDELVEVGILPVVAVGNDGRNTSCSPGNYRSPLSVGSTNEQGRVSAFSGGGQLLVNHQMYHVPHLVAPGENIISSIPGGKFEAWDGTSMACPIVSGLAALLLEKHPDATVLQLKEELLNACVSLGAPAHREGSGLVQLP